MNETHGSEWVLVHRVILQPGWTCPFFSPASEDKVWTTVTNSLPPQTSVTGSSRERRTVLQLNYSASMEQVSAITGSAEYCEQHVGYTCRMSRLLNTPGKGRLTLQTYRSAHALAPEFFTLLAPTLRAAYFDARAAVTLQSALVQFMNILLKLIVHHVLTVCIDIDRYLA